MSLNKAVRAGVSAARVQTRARILLLADRSQGERRTQKQIAEAVQACELTIGTTCRRGTRRCLKRLFVFVSFQRADPERRFLWHLRWSLRRLLCVILFPRRTMRTSP